MDRPFGRLTARGGDAVEALLTDILRRVGQEIGQRLPEAEIRALVLLGGYGRGEGGVIREGQEERPHNNLDFLLIHNEVSPPRERQMHAIIRESLDGLAKEFDLGMDSGIIGASKLRRAPCLIMWYDMRYGHKTILGDEAFVPSLGGFFAERILPWDARNLLVNRGTLLVINDLLLERAQLSLDQRKLVIKHAIKAIIGYGDALLFFLGDYDWSYLEKQRRMRARRDVDPGMRALYEEALEFRFSPHYAAYLEKDLAAWMDDLRAAFAAAHLECERARLKQPGLAWASYLPRACRHALWDQPMAGRQWAKKAVNVLRTAGVSGLSARAAGMRGLLPLLFPVVAYDLHEAKFLASAKAILRAKSEHPHDLRTAYLLQWAIHGDPNFAAVVRKFGLDLG